MTRALTPQEARLLDARREAIGEVIASIEPALVELADHLGHPRPAQAPDDLDGLLDRLDAVLPRLDLEALDEAQLGWLTSHLLCFIGAWLVAHHDAHWHLQDDPGSPFFLRFVVGGFAPPADPHLMIDPLEVARHVLEDPARPLRATLTHITVGPP